MGMIVCPLHVVDRMSSTFVSNAQRDSRDSQLQNKFRKQGDLVANGSVLHETSALFLSVVVLPLCCTVAVSHEVSTDSSRAQGQ